MQKAIITGSTGLVGRAVASYLINQGVEVLCLGRRKLSQPDIQNMFGRPVLYIPLAMEEIDQLPETVKSVGWNGAKGIVFFHFAWRGCHRLTDGDFSDQIKNAIFSANAVKAAKRAGCTKFIDSGTLEETFIASNIHDDHSPIAYSPSQSNYGLAKIAARDLCNIVAYLEKIDYIHTRLSVPLDEKLKQGTYVANTLHKIKKNEPYDLPTNANYFDMIPLSEVAKAYKHIAELGKNKADYFIGTGYPITLSDFFNRFYNLLHCKENIASMTVPKETTDLFSMEQLQKDTGFAPQTFLQVYRNQIMDKMYLQNHKEDCR